ncbi:hypothetical protein Tco_1238810 [Tanacetum coccineum]
MAYSSSSSNANSKVHTCSTECEQSYAQLKKLYDTQREQLGDASIEIQAYTQALKKVEAQLVAHQKNQLWYEEKIRFMKIDLDDKTDVLTYHKKLLAEAVKEKEELKTKLESFETSSKSLNTLLNSQLSANDKAGFGHNGAKESKVSETITSVSKVETSNSETSNDKAEMPKIKIVRMSEPIIEEWESDNEDDEIVVKPKEVTKIVKPSFEKIESVNARNETVRQAENPRKNNKSPRGNKRNWNGMMTQKLGEHFEFNNKACYVNTVKASTRWVWKPKHEELDHVFKSNSASKTLTRYDYVDALGRSKHLGFVNFLILLFDLVMMCEKRDEIGSCLYVTVVYEISTAKIPELMMFVGYSLVKPYYEWVNGEQEALKVSGIDATPDPWIVVLRIGKLQGIGEFSSVGFISTQQMFTMFYYEELAIPGQTETGKESSNPFMARSLPKPTIHFCDSLQSDEDSFELIELMILCTNFLTMGRIDDADAEVTFIDETSNDVRNKNNTISNKN